MKIGFDARMIDRSGIGTYISSLLSEMIPIAGEQNFTLFGDPQKLRAFSTFKNVEFYHWDPPIYSFQEQISAPFNNMDLDLMHFPHYNICLRCNKKIVVTVHDLIHLLCPEGDFSFLARIYAKYMISKAVKRSTKVISVSDSTSNDLIKMFGDRYKKKIKVIHESALNGFTRLEDKSKKKQIREKYGISGDFIFYVGNIKPHKNIDTLFKVYSKLKEWGLPHQLIIAGKWDEKMKDLKSNIDSQKVLYLGEVPTEDLIGLYSMAGVLLHLSLYEGFGLTILEAMSCGCPVVTTAVSSLPEVAGQAAFYVSPLEIGQIADTVYNVLAHKDFRDKMAEAGIHQAHTFSWEKAARETLEIYKRVKQVKK